MGTCQQGPEAGRSDLGGPAQGVTMVTPVSTAACLRQRGDALVRVPKIESGGEALMKSVRKDCFQISSSSLQLVSSSSEGVLAEQEFFHSSTFPFMVSCL